MSFKEKENEWSFVVMFNYNNLILLIGLAW